MKEKSGSHCYVILVHGHLSDSWLSCFKDLKLTRLWTGNTRITGTVKDDSELYGVIEVLRDMGVSIKKIKQSRYRCNTWRSLFGNKSHRKIIDTIRRYV